MQDPKILRQEKTDLSRYNNSWFNTGGNFAKRFLWYFTNVLFFICPLNPSSFLKKWLLILFGAKIGKGVVIKPGVNIKYPWNLEIGDYVWIGENVWIDNLTKVEIGNNVVISQGALLLCGNHNYAKSTFDLMIGEIHLEDGAWVGAKCIVCGGVTMHSHSVLSVNSVASNDLDAFCIYRGNPATFKKNRIINS